MGANCCSEPKIHKSYDPRDHEERETEEINLKHAAEEKAYLESLKELGHAHE